MEFLTTITNHLAEHWGVVLAIASFALVVFNLLSKYYGEHKGLMKALTFASELVSLFCSLGARRNDGLFGKLKWPGTRVPPGGGGVSSSGSGLAPAFVAIALLACGCSATGTWSEQADRRLDQLGAVLQGVRPIGRQVFVDVCGRKAVSCRDARRTAEVALKACTDDVCRNKQADAIEAALRCPPLTSCHKARDIFTSSLVGAWLAIADGKRLLVATTELLASPKLTTIVAQIGELIAAAQKSVAAIRGL